MIETNDQFEAPEQNRVGIIFRWIAMVPAALVGCLAGRFIILLIVNIGMSRFCEPGSLIWRIAEHWFSGLALGVSFVYIASWVAPMHKKPVACSAAAFVLVLAGFFLFSSLITGNYWPIIEIVSMGIGGSAIAYCVLKEEITF